MRRCNVHLEGNSDRAPDDGGLGPQRGSGLLEDVLSDLGVGSVLGQHLLTDVDGVNVALLGWQRGGGGGGI